MFKPRGFPTMFPNLLRGEFRKVGPCSVQAHGLRWTMATVATVETIGSFDLEWMFTNILVLNSCWGNHLFFFGFSLICGWGNLLGKLMWLCLKIWDQHSKYNGVFHASALFWTFAFGGPILKHIHVMIEFHHRIWASDFHGLAVEVTSGYEEPWLYDTPIGIQAQ